MASLFAILQPLRRIILYSIVLGLLLVLMQYVQYRFLFIRRADSIYTGIVAAVCCAAGIWGGWRWNYARRHNPAPETPLLLPDSAVTDTNPEAVIARLGLTPREMEVLQHMSKGLSNQEIADAMFVSLNTVKTHISNVFSKLDVQRRTQAIQKVKSMGLLAN